MPMTHLPNLGVGCAALAVRSPETEDDAVVELLVHARARGVRCFDVAPLYGGGRGEVLLGRALARMDGPVTVSTKVGYVGDIPYGGRQPPEERRKDFSRGAIERSLEQSLRRLGRERVDWLFLHDPGDDVDPIERIAWPALQRLCEQGLVGGVGVGTTRVTAAHAALDRLPLACLLLAGRWTLLDRTGGSVVDRCRALGVPLMAGGVFNSGLLAADRPAEEGTFDYAPAPAPMLARAGQAQRLCAAAGVSLKAAALQFPRAHPGVTTTLLGPRTRREFDELLALWRTPLTASFLAELDRLGPPDVTTP
jgi:D-threo-aldose 1-dehydrogenase